MLWFVYISFTVFVLASFKELSCWESWVLCWWFVDLETVVIKVVCDDKLTNCIFWFGIVEGRSESQTDLLINPFEKVFLWWFGDQFINVSQGVLLWSDTIVWGNYNVYDNKFNTWSLWADCLRAVQVLRKANSKPDGIIVSSKLIASFKEVLSAKNGQVLTNKQFFRL